jgi:hypothetical protein
MNLDRAGGSSLQDSSCLTTATILPKAPPLDSLRAFDASLLTLSKRQERQMEKQKATSGFQRRRTIRLTAEEDDRQNRFERLSSEFMHDIRHHAPDVHMLPLSDVNSRYAGFSGASNTRPLRRIRRLIVSSPLQHRDHHPPGSGLGGTIHNEQIPVMNSRPKHGITHGSHKIGSRRIVDQQFVQIDLLVHVIISRWRKSGRHRRKVQRNPLIFRDAIQKSRSQNTQREGHGGRYSSRQHMNVRVLC